MSSAACLILLNSGDIETNPGPTFSIKTVAGSCHQGDPKYGPTAGTQCMCNSLASLCYSNIIQIRFWTTSDIDKILTYGNNEYARLGYINDYLSFDDVPSTFNLGDCAVELEKSERSSGYLNRESMNFIQFISPFTNGLFIAGGLTTGFMFQNQNVYIFDSHSRNSQGFVCPEGTAVLLKFDSLFKAQEYIKYFFLHQLGYSSIGYEYQLFKSNVSQSAIDYIKNSRLKENKKAVKSRERANFCPKKKAVELLNNRKRVADIRMQASPEKKAVELSNARTRMANFRANMSPLNVEKHKLIDKKRKKPSLNRTELFKSEIKIGPYFICVAVSYTHLTLPTIYSV